MKVGDIACGRSGDKGELLDLTLVALDNEGYAQIRDSMTVERAQQAISRVMPGKVTRYEVPGLRVLKFVVEGALPGGVYANLHAGLHWQKAAAYILVDLDLEAPSGT